VFPELRKQREDKERFNRVGARIKSEADLEEIMDGLQEQEVYYITNSIYIKAITKRAMYNTSKKRKINKNYYGEDKTVGGKRGTLLNEYLSNKYHLNNNS